MERIGAPCFTLSAFTATSPRTTEPCRVRQPSFTRERCSIGNPGDSTVTRESGGVPSVAEWPANASFERAGPLMLIETTWTARDQLSNTVRRIDPEHT